MTGVRWWQGLEVRCFPVSETVPQFVFLFRALLTHPTMSSVSLSFFFLCVCLRKMLTMNDPRTCRAREREKGVALFPCTPGFPLTSASRTLHQQESGTIRKRKQWQGNCETRPATFTLRPKHFMSCNQFRESCGLVNWDGRNFIGTIGFALNKSLQPHLPCFYTRSKTHHLCLNTERYGVRPHNTHWCTHFKAEVCT